MQWMASAMRAARSQLDVATQNLANVSSDGFRRLATTLDLDARGLRVRRETSAEQGAIRRTNRSLDVAILGPGAFRVGGEATRNGAFVRDRDGYLADDRGRRLAGRCGPIRFPDGAAIGADGSVRTASGRLIDRISLPPGTRLETGALETSNVNAIAESLNVLEAQRSFETAQKVLVAIDDTRNKAANDVGRVQ
jgi:flagellar basal-body rod protein FlgG